MISGGSVIISSFDVPAAGVKLQIPTGATLTVNSDNTSTSFLGTITGAGSLVLANGTFTVGQVNVFTGSVEIQAGTLTAGLGNTAGSLGTGTLTIDAGATFLLAEPGTPLAPTTIASNIASGAAGQGLITILGNSTKGAVVLSGNNANYSGSLVINGGRFAAASVASLGSMSQILVTGSGQFSYGTLTNVNMTVPLTLASTGFTDTNGTNALLFTGTTNTWSGQIILAATARIGALGASGTIAGEISGPAGNDLQIGNGTSAETVFLTGNNSYSGATVIAANATIAVGNNNAAGVLSPNTAVTVSGVLAYDRTDPSTWTQSIAGAGSLRVRRAGILVLDGSTFSATVGSVYVGNGTLTLANGEALSVSGLTSVGDNSATGVILTTGTAAGILNVPSGTSLVSNTLDVGTNGAWAS